MSDTKRFVGRVALVTGGGNGIGRATALRLAREGCVVAVADRDEAAWAQTVELADDPSRVKGFTLDVANEDEVARVVTEVTKSLGAPDVLCLAAGVLNTGDVADQALELWDHTMGVNLRGQLLVLRQVLPGMQARRSGAIVMLSSVSALVGDRGVSAYAVSKAGVSSLAKQVAAESASYGVRCNAVCPGWIDTPFNDVVFANAAERAAEVHRTVPLGREGTPDEVASLIAFLCSDEAAYITGSSMLIDGGLLLGVNG